MHVIGHQHVGVHRTTLAQADLTQLVQIADMIDVLGEARLTVIASLYDVLWHPGKIESRLTRQLAVHTEKSDLACCAC